MLIAVLMIAAAPSFAQETVRFERVLLPMVAEPIDGANGSRFTSEWGLLVQDDLPVTVHSADGLFGSSDPTTTYMPLFGSGSSRGRFMFIEAGRPWVAFASLTSYAADGSSAHTPLPVVRERDALGGRATFGPLKTDPVLHPGPYPALAGYRHRHTLRIYDFDSVGDLEFRVTMKLTWRTFRPGDTRTVRLASDCTGCPPYVEIALIPFFGEPWSMPLPRGCCSPIDALIEVEPVQPNVRYFAFISTTENDSQHVAIHTRR